MQLMLYEEDALLNTYSSSVFTLYLLNVHLNVITICILDAVPNAHGSNAFTLHLLNVNAI